MIINVVSVWMGAKYGPDYVPILHDMIGRNLSNIEQRHWCLTDRPEEIPEGIHAVEPPEGYGLDGWWWKLALFSDLMPWDAGDRMLFMDLDSAVVGRLEDLAERKGAVLDWHMDTLNSSVMVWDHGEHRGIWSQYAAMSPADRQEMRERLHGDQDWIDQVSRQEWDWFPKDWVLSYRKHATSWPPSGSKVVCFHGEPKPHDATGWVPNVWKLNGFTSLPEMTGVNVSYETLHENVKANVPRKLPWFTGFREHSREAVLVCGGPSLAGSIEQIRNRRHRGASLITVNNAMRFLLEHGLTPTTHVMLDARPENVSFVQNAPEKVQYLLASQCHPSLFDALSDRNVVMWHNAIGEGDELQAIAKPYEDFSHPLLQVPGGCTVGLRAMYLIFISGFRKLHIYGMDSSYEDKAHHAYQQPLNDGEPTLSIAMGEKRYTCARWMVRQAEEYRGQFHDLTDRGMRIWQHGRGLIPDMTRAMVRERAAA
jgi:hypothetical protein